MPSRPGQIRNHQRHSSHQLPGVGCAGAVARSPTGRNASTGETIADCRRSLARIWNRDVFKYYNTGALQIRLARATLGRRGDHFVHAVGVAIAGIIAFSYADLAESVLLPESDGRLILGSCFEPDRLYTRAEELFLHIPQERTRDSHPSVIRHDIHGDDVSDFVLPGR